MKIFYYFFLTVNENQLTVAFKRDGLPFDDQQRISVRHKEVEHHRKRIRRCIEDTIEKQDLR